VSGTRCSATIARSVSHRDTGKKVLKIVVDDPSDWSPFYPSEQVVSFADYLALPEDTFRQPLRVINLCKSDRYLSRGYYCSLLAEARGHRVLPGVATLNILRNRKLFLLEFDDLEERIDELLREHPLATGETFKVVSCFGRVKEQALAPLAREARTLGDRFTGAAFALATRRGPPDRFRGGAGALQPCGVAPSEGTDALPL
jgi:hypothetical protein